MTTSTGWGNAPAFLRDSGGDPGEDIGERVEQRLADLLNSDRERYARITPQSAEVVEALLTAVLGGGKRLRPVLAFLAFVGAGGSPADPRVVDAGAALELLHTGCLVHDDVMDASPTRRGLPTTHARYERLHRRARFSGESRRFGEGIATVVGDVAFFYSIGLLRSAGPEAQQVFFEMAVDAGVGQYLDLFAAACPSGAAPDPLVIARYKTGRYTVEGPLRLGAALAGRLVELGEAFTAYGQPVGLAYQLRDDLLGAFGDPAVTGKPVGDDLLQGKRTLLLAYAKRQARSPAARELLSRVEMNRLAGAEVPEVQRLLVDLGARDRVERTCATLSATAVDALGSVDIEAAAKENLTQFARYVAGVPAGLRESRHTGVG